MILEPRDQLAAPAAGAARTTPPQCVRYLRSHASATISRVANLNRADRCSRLANLSSIRSCRSPRHGSSRLPGFLGSFPRLHIYLNQGQWPSLVEGWEEYIAAGGSRNKRISAVLADVPANPAGRSP